jgi:hypothetical protein
MSTLLIIVAVGVGAAFVYWIVKSSNNEDAGSFGDDHGDVSESSSHSTDHSSSGSDHGGDFGGGD